MVQKITIEAEIKASRDANSFNQAKKEVEQIGKGLDNALDVEINRAKLVEQLKAVNAELRKTTDERRRIELQVDARRLRGEISKAERQIKELEGRTGGLQKAFVGAFTQIGIAAAGAFSIGAITRFVGQTFQLASQVESARQSFITLTKSVETTNTLLSEIDEFAARTPFNKLGIIDATKRLLGFGFAAEDTLPTLEAVGNAVAAVGGTTETLDGVIAALGQIEAKGKLSTEEVLQIAERGIPIFQILQDQLGLTNEQLGDLGNQAISSTEAIPAIVQGLQTAFAGSLEAQAQTLQGQLSNLIDSFENLAASIGERLRPVFEFLLQAGAGLITFFTEFGNVIGFTTAGLGGLALAFGLLSGPIGVVTIGITALVSALGFLSDGVGEVSERSSQLQSQLANLQSQIVALDKEFQAGSIGIDDYQSSKQDLINQSVELQGLIAEEVVQQRELNRALEESNEVIEENEQKIADATGQLDDFLKVVAEADDTTEEGRATILKYSLAADVQARKVAEASAEIAKQELAQAGLIATQEVLTGTNDLLNSSLDKISTAKSREEFNQYRIEALKQILSIQGQIKAARELSRVQGDTQGIERANQALQNLITEAVKIQNLPQPEFSVRTTGEQDIIEEGKKAVAAARGSGRALKSEAEKQAEEQERIRKEQEAELARIAEEETKKQEEELARQVDAYEDAFDQIEDTIKSKQKTVDDFTKEIEKSTERIEDIDAKLADLEASTAQDLASRFVQVQAELETEDLTGEQQQALQQELNLIRQNTTEAERQEAVRQEGLSTTERILEARDAEIAALQEQRAVEEENLRIAEEGRQRELQAIQSLRDLEKALSEEAIAQTQNEFRAKERAAEGYEARLDSIIQKTIELNSLSGGSQQVSGLVGQAAAGAVTETVLNVEINQEISETVDVDFVNQEIINAIQTSQQT